MQRWAISHRTASLCIHKPLVPSMEFPWWLSGKEFACQCRMWVRSLVWEDLLEREMATHSSILAWEIPWTEKPGGLQSMESKKSDMTWQLKTSPFHMSGLGPSPRRG